MSVNFELVIRGGSIADGLGGELYTADVAVQAGTIAKVGNVPERGQEEIDARGLIVAPGFIDIHTHYDGQAVWDERFCPSSWHGVTTAVMGNCGVGFAPVRAKDHDSLIELMEGIEDIPGIALHQGLDWQWETFGQYLDALERRPHDIDFCAQLPHAPLRVYVMGERAIRLENATSDDCARMREIACDAMLAGAVGFSTSRSINHKTLKGVPTPTLRAAENELTAIAMGLKDAGRGVIQIISDFEDDVEEEFALMRCLVEASGRPLSFSLMQKHTNKTGWRRLLELTSQAAGEGLPIKAQIAPRGVGVLLSLEASRNVFSECPSFREIAHLPLEEKIAALRGAQLREALLHEIEHMKTPLGQRLAEFNNIYIFGESTPDYDPGAGSSIAAIAERKGRKPSELAFDLLLANGGRQLLYSPFANYADDSIAVCAEMIANENTVIGLGDGGAHVGVICDSSFPTFLLSHWGNKTKRFELPWLIKRHTSDAAEAIGLHDRGVIAPGKKADINIIDASNLSIEMPNMQYDLPGGGRRLLQRANGYLATIVAGNVVYREGQATGSLPGRLVRSAHTSSSIRGGVSK